MTRLRMRLLAGFAATIAMALIPTVAMATTDVSNGQDGQPSPNERLDYQTAEQYQDIPAGQTVTAHEACPFGYTVADGHAYVQSLDQGTGQISDIQSLESYASDQATWTFTLRNPDPGDAHAQLEITCISNQTNTNASIQPGTNQSQTVTSTPGLTNLEIFCPSGQMVIAPGYSIGGSGTVFNYSVPNHNGNSWQLGFESQNGGDPITVSVHCLGTNLSDGQQIIDYASYQWISIPPTSTNGPTDDESYQAPVGYNSLIGSAELPEASSDSVYENPVYLNGEEPQGRTELFHFTNPTGQTQQVRIGTLILGINSETSVQQLQQTSGFVPSASTAGSNAVTQTTSDWLQLSVNGGSTSTTKTKTKTKTKKHHKHHKHHR